MVAATGIRILAGVDFKTNRHNSLIVAISIGIGMIPRGEVGMVVAQIGLSLGVISQNIYGVMIFMAVATTLVAPPLLKLAFRGPVDVADETKSARHVEA